MRAAGYWISVVVVSLLCGEAVPALAGEVAAPLEFVVATPKTLRRLTVAIEVDGVLLPAIWETTFRDLHAYFDLDGDGKLDRNESQRLPSPYWMRQVLWSPTVSTTGIAPAWESLDADHDDAVTVAEVAAFYRRKYVGHATVGIGFPPSTERLTKVLVKQLDKNADERVDASEWETGLPKLMDCDANDDELVGASELLPKIAYPGASGAILMQPLAADQVAKGGAEASLLRLTDDLRNEDWADVLLALRDVDRNGKCEAQEMSLAEGVFEKLDQDGDRSLTHDELVRWRTQSPDFEWKVQLQFAGQSTAASGSHGDSIQEQAGSVALRGRRVAGALPGLHAEGIERLEKRLRDVDTNRDGIASAEELKTPDAAELRESLRLFDRDGDGQVSSAELTAWHALRTQIAHGHALITVLDFGSGLFEFIDSDHDGSLSRRELTVAAGPDVRKVVFPDQAPLNTARLPRTVLLFASLGHPVAPLGSIKRAGPDWFVAMDRNQDGDISAREFLSDPAEFNRLDRDGNGLISVSELP